jgi:hypothetical protein
VRISIEGLWQVASAPKCSSKPKLTNLLHGHVSTAASRPFVKISNYSGFTHRCSVEQRYPRLIFERWLSAEIENNTGWNFKHLAETMGNSKTLKRNNKGRAGILIGPSMAPSFFSIRKNSSGLLRTPVVSRSRHRFKFSRRGWQPTSELWQF